MSSGADSCNQRHVGLATQITSNYYSRYNRSAFQAYVPLLSCVVLTHVICCPTTPCQVRKELLWISPVLRLYASWKWIVAIATAFCSSFNHFINDSTIHSNACCLRFTSIIGFIDVVCLKWLKIRSPKWSGWRGVLLWNGLSSIPFRIRPRHKYSRAPFLLQP